MSSPPGIERLRETIEVLSDNDLLRDLHAGLDDMRADRVVSTDDVAADLRRRRTAVTRPDAYAVVFTATARRGTNRLPAAAAVALFEHLAGPGGREPVPVGSWRGGARGPSAVVPRVRVRTSPHGRSAAGQAATTRWCCG